MRIIRYFTAISMIFFLHIGFSGNIFAGPYDFSSIPDNTWVKLNPDLYDHNGNLITEFPWNPYSGMVYNSDSGTILMFGGGGHGNREGNDVWEFNISRNEWRQHYAPEPEENYPTQSGEIGHDRESYLAALHNGEWWPPGSTKMGRPWTSHSYDQLAWDPINHEMIFYGPNFCFGYNTNYYQQAGYSYAYNPVTKTWSFINQKLGSDYAKPGDIVKVQMGAMEYYPPTQEIIFRQHGMRAYNVTNRTWDTNAISLPSGRSFSDSVMVYDNINQQLLMYSSENYNSEPRAELWAYHPETKTFEQLALDSISPPGGPSGAAFDSLNGVMIIWGEGDTGDFHPTWAYDTRTDQWTKMNPPSEPTASKRQGHVFGHMAYDPVHNVVIMINGDGTTWAYRYASSNSPNQVDTTSPYVISTRPSLNSENQPINSTISVNFSERLDISTLNSETFIVTSDSTNISGAISHTGLTAIFTPSSNLDYNTTYFVTINTDIADIAGNTLEADYNFEFTTEAIGQPLIESSSYVTHIDPVPETAPTKPPVGQWWTDPDFGGSIMRLHDFMDQGGRGFHVYSDMTVWSANMKYYALIANGEVNIYNWPDRTLKRQNIGIGTATFFFSLVDDNIIYYLSGTSLKQYNISTVTISVVHDFSDVFSRVRNSAIKPTSNNGRYMSIPGNLTDGSGGCLRYDFHTDTSGPIVPTGTETECAISPDGDYLLPLHSRGFGGIKCFESATGAFIRSLDENANTPHSDVIKDSNGKQWIVYQYTLTGKLRKASIPYGEIFDLLDTGFIGDHISSNQKNGNWVVVSTYTPPEDATKPFADEIIRVYLDSTSENPHVERLVHHRSRSLGTGKSPICYWKQPHASVSPDGNYVMFGSSWLEECIIEPTDKVEPYVLALNSSIGETELPASPVGLRIVSGP